MALTSAQITAMHTELTTDPLSLGYAALITAGNDAGLVSILNDVTKATAGPKVNVTAIATELVIGALVFSEMTSLTTNQLLILLLVCTVVTINPNDANTRAIFSGLFGSGTTTRANLLALSQRVGTRAEQLFGSGVAAALSDVSLALRGH